MSDVPGVSKHAARRYPYRFVCRVCGEPFHARRCTARYCSPACRQAVSRAARDHALMVAAVTKLDAAS